nr:MAG TPA: protein of unknown function (DUF1998) [Caudoviricetes sp.]
MSNSPHSRRGRFAPAFFFSKMPDGSQPPRTASDPLCGVGCPSCGTVPRQL